MHVRVAYHSQRATAVAETTVDISVLLHWELGPARVGETKPQESPERPWQDVHRALYDESTRHAQRLC